jgi:hypothetical protein
MEVGVQTPEKPVSRVDLAEMHGYCVLRHFGLAARRIWLYCTIISRR